MSDNSRLFPGLTFGLTLAVSLVAVILAGICYSCSHFITPRHLNARMEYLTDEFTRIPVFPLWNNDQDVVRRVSEAFLKSEYLIGIRVITEYGDVLDAHLPELEEPALVRGAMIRQGDHYFGQVRLQFSRQTIKQRPRETILAVVLVGVPSIVIIIVAARFFLKCFLERSGEGPS